MDADATLSDRLPDPDLVRRRIEALAEERKALMRLLRASLAARQADDARHGRKSLSGGEGVQDAS